MPGHTPQRARVRSDLFRTFRRLDPHALGLTDESISESDVPLQTTEARVTRAFGVYSRDGLERALREYGAIAKLESRGVGQVDVQLHLDDPFRPNIRLVSREFKKPIVDLTLSRHPGRFVGLSGAFTEVPLLYLDAITLQHPGKRFEWSRPPLPGQEHPGLSLSGEILDLLLLTARRVQTEGLSLRPSSFHAARVYEKHFQFVDPAWEGTFRALRHAGELRPLWLLAWAVETGCVREGARVFKWEPKPMLAPLTEELDALFTSAEYLKVSRAHEARKFDIDFALLRDRFPWNQMPRAKPPMTISALLRK